jgi:hypothetical protein
MIFYNYESYFGKRKVIKDKKDEKPSGPQGVVFDVAKYQWLLMVEKLCTHLNMKPHEVYEMNYIDCLNWLSMFNQRDKYIREQQK